MVATGLDLLVGVVEGSSAMCKIIMPRTSLFKSHHALTENLLERHFLIRMRTKIKFMLKEMAATLPMMGITM